MMLYKYPTFPLKLSRFTFFTISIIDYWMGGKCQTFENVGNYILQSKQKHQTWKRCRTWYGLHKIRVSDRVSREAEPETSEFIIS